MLYWGTPPASSQNCACWPALSGRRAVAAFVDRLAAVDREVAGLLEAVEAIAADAASAKPAFVGVERELSDRLADRAAGRRRCRSAGGRLKTLSSSSTISSSVAESRRRVVEPSVTSAWAPLSVAIRSPVVSGRLRSTAIHSLASGLNSQTLPLASLSRAARSGGSADRRRRLAPPWARADSAAPRHSSAVRATMSQRLQVAKRSPLR